MPSPADLSPKEKDTRAKDSETKVGEVNTDKNTRESSLSLSVVTGPLPSPSIFNEYPPEAQTVILQSMQNNRHSATK